MTVLRRETLIFLALLKSLNFVDQSTTVQPSQRKRSFRKRKRQWLLQELAYQQASVLHPVKTRRHNERMGK